MFLKKRLWQMSVILLLINVLLAGVALFNFLNQTRQIDKLKQDLTSKQDVLGTNANVPVFNNGFVLSDETFRSSRVFPTEESIQQFLVSINSPLRNYTDQGQRASFWVFNAANGSTSSQYGITPKINPGVLLAFLEKEQSLLTIKNYDLNADPEKRIRTAMGYGCPDTAKCDQVYFGFANQLNLAAYQLELNFQQASTNGGGTQYIIQKTITTLDEYNVFIQNRATASVYRYTPHVYWGNYNLWKILTAYGWGVDATTYKMSDIDAVNLANKDIKVAEAIPPISDQEVDRLVKTNFTLGDQSEDIKLLQKYLRQQGFYTTRESSGLYGTVTQQAHQAFLKSRGINIVNPTQTPNTPTKCQTLYSQEWKQGVFYGDDGRALQQCLREGGFFNWPANTGFIGEVTLNSLQQARSSLAISATSNNPQTPQNICDQLKTVAWKYGTSSEEVKQLQSCMRQAGVFNWPNGDTGYFGDATQAAFQKWAGNSPSTAGVTASVGSQSCETLKQGSYRIGQSGPEIVKLQACMRQAGVFNWPKGDTGYYGPVSAESFARWTGVSFNSKFDCSDLKKQTWIKEETSDRVRQLQACMRDAGVFNWPGGNTGYFGDATEKAVIAWRGYL